MPKPEKEVQRDIIKYVRSRGGWVIKVMVANERGCPDLLICLEGMFIGCETKAGRFIPNPIKQASAWQKRHLEAIKEAKGIAMCVASLEQFKLTISDYAI